MNIKDIHSSGGAHVVISDAGRNIAKISYDNLNNPTRIQFTDGNVTKYIYSATGEKLIPQARTVTCIPYTLSMDKWQTFIIASSFQTRN